MGLNCIGRCAGDDIESKREKPLANRPEFMQGILDESGSAHRASTHSGMLKQNKEKMWNSLSFVLDTRDSLDEFNWGVKPGEDRSPN